MSTRSRVSCVAVVTVLLAAVALPASAVKTTYGIDGATCVANPTSSTYVTTTQNSSCNHVYAGHYYRPSNGGDRIWQSATSYTRASVSASTSMVTERSHGVSVMVGGSERWLYFR